MRLTKTAISRPVTVTMFFLAIALLGFYSFSQLGVDLLPNVNLPQLLVQTTYPNASPEEVEKLVSEPLESAVGTVPGVKKIQSVSKEGISVISIEFVWGTDMNLALLTLREKLDNMSFVLPDQAGRPTIIRTDPSSSPVVTLALSYKNRNSKQNDTFNSKFVDEKSSYIDIKRLIDLKEVSRVVFKRRMEQIEGVAQAVITGGIEREIVIEADPKKLESYNITYSSIENALSSSNRNLPAGSIMRGLFRYSLRTMGEFNDISEIEQTVINRLPDGNTIKIKDVATVREFFKERDGLTRLNGAETIGMLVYKEPDANTVDIAKEVKRVSAVLDKEYPEYNLVVVSDQSGFISDAIENVKQEIMYGGVLAVIVLFFFLGNIRHILIIGITIPSSLVLTILLMYLFGINFNIISLGGIALGVGMLLDNAIIVIENVVSYREKGLSVMQAALKGSTEVAMPIVAATLTTIVVFLPLVFMKGISGELFKDQSYAIVFSLTSSIITAVTLIPMLAAREKLTIIKNPEVYSSGMVEFNYERNMGLFRKIKFWLIFPFVFVFKGGFYLMMKICLYIKNVFGKIFDKFFGRVNKFLDHTIEYYEKLLDWSLNNKPRVLWGTLILLVITVLAVMDMKKEFIPEAPQSEFIVELEYPKGISLKGNADYTRKIESEILKYNEVDNLVSNIGRTNEFDFLNKEQVSINKTNLIVKLKSFDDFYSVQEKLKQKLTGMKGIKYSFKQVKTSYTQIIAPNENDIIIKIKEKDTDRALAKANEVITTLKKSKVEGLKNIRLATDKTMPQYEIIIDREKCKLYNIDINRVVSEILQIGKGTVATNLSDFDKKINIILKTDNEYKNDADKAFSNYIDNGKVKVQIKDLITYTLKESMSEVWREDLARTIYIYADVEERKTSAVVDDIKEKLAGINLEKDELIEIGGSNDEIKSSFENLYIALIISVLLMYMILASEFESFLFPFIIIFAVPLGLIGGILLLYIFGESISIISLMGLLILVGIADNDAVVKVEFILRKRAEGFNVRDAIKEAGKDRFRPIVMNSLTVIFGLIPMILGFGAGTQLRISLSLAIAGGLVSSTILTLIIIPVLYSYLEKFSKKKYI